MDNTTSSITAIQALGKMPQKITYCLFLVTEKYSHGFNN